MLQKICSSEHGFRLFFSPAHREHRSSGSPTAIVGLGRSLILNKKTFLYRDGISHFLIFQSIHKPLPSQGGGNARIKYNFLVVVWWVDHVVVVTGKLCLSSNVKSYNSSCKLRLFGTRDRRIYKILGRIFMLS